MSTPLLLRGAALALVIVPITADSIVRRRDSESGARPVFQTEKVRLTAEPGSVAACTTLGEIDLSGSAPDSRGRRVEDERDAILRSIAAHEGANVVFVLRKSAQFIQSRAYACPNEGGRRR